MKLTDWFRSDVRPARCGVYEVRFLDYDNQWAHWNGTAWGWAHNTPKQAARFKRTNGATQSKEWRGLASKDGK